MRIIKKNILVDSGCPGKTWGILVKRLIDAVRPAYYKFLQRLMSILEQQPAEAISRLRALRRGIGQPGVLYLTNPETDAPVERVECLKIRGVQFFGATGFAVLSIVHDNVIALARVNTDHGQFVWARPTHEAILATVPWRSHRRIRVVE